MYVPLEAKDAATEPSMMSSHWRSVVEENESVCDRDLNSLFIEGACAGSPPPSPPKIHCGRSMRTHMHLLKQLHKISCEMVAMTPAVISSRCGEEEGEK